MGLILMICTSDKGAVTGNHMPCWCHFCEYLFLLHIDAGRCVLELLFRQRDLGVNCELPSLGPYWVPSEQALRRQDAQHN